MSNSDTPAKVGSSEWLGRTVPAHDLLQRLRDERDLCAAEHADDIANLLHEAVLHITTLEHDAKRYRWLAGTLWTCELNQYSGPARRQYLWGTRFSSPLHNENATFDAAVDAAIEQGERL